jgi:Delta7-sterol 5-desaturase
MVTNHPLETIINGPAHHTLHHLYFTVNYGQYFTWADRWSGTYRQPAPELDPLIEVRTRETNKEALGKAE